MISDDKLEAALSYLAETDCEAAGARAQRLRAEFARERIRARLTLESGEGSDTRRRAWAETQPEYAVACETEVQAVQDDEFFRNKRNTANVIVEAWRSENANRRAGSSFK
jgi:hypothetical protein